MGARRGGTEIAPMVRGAFIRAVKDLENKGKPLSTIIKDQLEKHPLETLKTIGSFIPKEMLIEATIYQELEQLTDEALDAEITRLAAEAGSLFGADGEAGATTH